MASPRALLETSRQLQALPVAQHTTHAWLAQEHCLTHPGSSRVCLLLSTAAAPSTAQHSTPGCNNLTQPDKACLTHTDKTLLHMLLIVSDVPSWHSSVPEGRPGVWEVEVQHTCMRYMGLEKPCATIFRKLGRPKAMSFMLYRCTRSLLFVVPMALNLSHVAPV